MATDYFKSTKSPATTVINPASNLPGSGVSGLADRKQSGFKPSTGKLTLTGGSGYNRHHSLYVDGDVFISDNIMYAGSGGWATLDAIPSLELYVKGNIYIKNTVTNLDGLFVAQPKDDGSKGKIYTCANGSGDLFAAGDLFAQCRQKLKVNGSFIAQETKFLRTAGTLSDVDTVPGTPVSSTGGTPAFNFKWTSYPPDKDPTKTKCVLVNEPSDPDTWSDNELCSATDYSLKWYYGGPSVAQRLERSVRAGTIPMNHQQKHGMTTIYVLRQDRICSYNSATLVR